MRVEMGWGERVVDLFVLVDSGLVGCCGIGILGAVLVDAVGEDRDEDEGSTAVGVVVVVLGLNDDPK